MAVKRVMLLRQKACCYPNIEAKKQTPKPVELALRALASQKEPLKPLLEGDAKYSKFVRRVLARILAYSADLIPAVTENPQNIDDETVNNVNEAVDNTSKPVTTNIDARTTNIYNQEQSNEEINEAKNLNIKIYK